MNHWKRWAEIYPQQFRIIHCLHVLLLWSMYLNEENLLNVRYCYRPSPKNLPFYQKMKKPKKSEVYVVKNLFWQLLQEVRNKKIQRIKPWHWNLLFKLQNKILIYPHIFAGITILKKTLTKLTLASYLCCSEARSLHQHHNGIGLIPARGPMVD